MFENESDCFPKALEGLPPCAPLSVCFRDFRAVRDEPRPVPLHDCRELVAHEGSLSRRLRPYSVYENFTLEDVMPTLSRIAPEIPVLNLASAVEYYQSRLGFELKMAVPAGDYAVLQRDGVAIHLFQTHFHSIQPACTSSPRNSTNCMLNWKAQGRRSARQLSKSHGAIGTFA